MEFKAVPLALYRALLRHVRESTVHTAWAALALDETHKLAGARLEEHVPACHIHDSESAAAFVRLAFRRHRGLRPKSKPAEDALDNGFNAYRLGNLLLELQRRRTEREDRAAVKFSVGSVIRHRRFGYRGVIVGWDPTCTQPAEWITTMRVADLPSGASQPFYYVLPDDPRSPPRYIAQDNVVPLTGEQIHSRSISLYFNSFSDKLGRYIPVPFIRYMFPDAYEEDVVAFATSTEEKKGAKVGGHEQLDNSSSVHAKSGQKTT
eukprot:jgi/Mesen1/3777/ME000205S03034